MSGALSAQPARVLVVDDEPNIADLVATALRYEGFDVRIAGDGKAALRTVREFRPQLVVLDVMLPDIDGFEVQRRLRGNGEPVSVLFLTARDSVQDRVRGLTLGGDDYLAKPFSVEELVARIRSVLRRTAPSGDAAARLVVGDLELDDETREVRRAGRRIELSPTEFTLLRYLMVNARRVLSKAQILDHVWQYDFNGDGRIVETYVSYLRKKVDRDAAPLIRTVRGVGYTIRQPED